ncbi:transporter substrate-binding domain-containing protein [Marinomonas sp. TI.3.20]|uniref:substrate-binding periplasmic protein n=1 Tax=Marinomonas sp. TI.3.20 TaxID=3121296 RepID=UPI00311D8CCD
MRSKILIFLLFWVFISPASADQFGCDSGVISVGVTQSGVMYHDGHGIDPDLLTLLSKITHCEFQLIPISRVDAFKLVERGEIDLVPSVTREPLRESFAWFIPYYEIKFLLLTNANRLPLVENLEQLKKTQGASIAKAQGSGYGTYFNYHLSEMASLGMVRRYADYGETVKALLNKEVDAILSVPQVYRFFFAEGKEPFPINIMDVSPATPTTVSLMLGKRRFSSPQVANWLRVIENLRLDGRLQSIMENYVSSDEAAAMLGAGSH